MGERAEDRRFMAAAIRLSRWHTGLTSTNPSIGCLIVRDGVIVGRAVTALSGRPHAEPQALAEAVEQARGATAYVSLEPCSHHGKTPPCVDALITAGIGRVVIAVTDPDPRVAGRGIERLRAAGITVETGVLEEESREALAGYLMRQAQNRPYVTLKLAVSTDGMIGRLGEGQVRVTGEIARAQVQVLRAETDAILVGIGTACADDPLLTCRAPGLEGRSPVRIVLDRRLELPPDGKLAKTARDVPVVVVAEGGAVANEEASLEARHAVLEAAGVEVLEASDLGSLLFTLASRGISSLLVEGGARTTAAFLEADLVDRILLFQGPNAIGPGGIESRLVKTDMREGFVLKRSMAFGSDRCDEYERRL